MAWTRRLFPTVLVLCLGTVHANYAAHPEAGTLIDELVRQHGFDASELTTLLAQASRQDGILEAISRPAEKTMPWHRYRAIFLGAERIAEGVTFWSENQAALDLAYKRYAVPPEYIVAIIGVETRFGRHRGAHRVLDALTTLAFDYPPRATFFRSELIQFLLLAREEHKAAATLMGSYAGAMGYGQFIASSYRRYAVDFDGDGTRDIWDNRTDAIGSVANYFAEHGWKGNMPLLVDLSPEEKALQAWVSTDLKPSRTLGEVRRAGIDGPAGMPDETPVSVLSFEHEDGLRTALAFNDFYVITRYNHSPLYARAVHELAQAIKAAQGTAQVKAE